MLSVAIHWEMVLSDFNTSRSHLDGRPVDVPEASPEARGNHGGIVAKPGSWRRLG